MKTEPRSNEVISILDNKPLVLGVILKNEMKHRSCLAFLFGLLMTLALSAQDKKKLYFDVYYGGPQNLVLNNKKTFNNIRVKGLGPLGMRFDFLLTPKSSFAADVLYTQVSFTSSEPFTVTEGSGSYESKKYVYSHIRTYIRYAYQYFQDDKTSIYFHAGIGGKFRSAGNTEIKETKYYPGGGKGFVVLNLQNGFSTAYSDIGYVVLRAGAGIRHMLFRSVGINAEVGIGGPLISAGMSVRLK